MHEPHRDQIEVVLERQGLAAVAETGDGTLRAAGRPHPAEDAAWRPWRTRASWRGEEVAQVLPDPAEREALERLVSAALVFRSPITGRVHALSRLVAHLM